MKKLLKLVGLIVLVLLVIVVARTFLATSKQVAAVAATQPPVDAQKAARDLSGSIPFQTISWEGGGNDEQKKATADAFTGFHAYLEKTFPQVYAKLPHETVGANNILFTWKGTDPALQPMLLTGHQDVVPIEPGTDSNWTHPPFSGEIADGFVWGRGTMDDKVTVVGILEAVDALLAAGYQPKRTVYLAFGQDEEIGGLEGAEKIGQLLKSRGVELEFLQDEGGLITQGMVPGVKEPVAVIGTSEKGYLSLVLTVDMEGGHSSMPPKESAIGILSEAVHRVETHPMPPHVHGPVGDFLSYAGGNAAFPLNAVFENLWLFGPLVQRILAASPDTNALLRSTAAPTIFRGGAKDNIMPSHAEAVVNFRILPGDSITSVTEHVRQVIHDPRVKLQPISGEPPAEPSKQSSPASPNFKRLQETVRQIYPDAISVPFVYIAASDTKHYAPITKDVYRFLPILAVTADLDRIHGTNERIAIENFAKAIQYYAQLLRNASE
ncbi:MAG TPA: M20 family peptidase [Candidatus Saccharimonadales bacterium]|nr:M20 family peptidase [Candidatus Saccharimonadales bacterium]